MDEFQKISSPEVFFVADSHFQNRMFPDEMERRELFKRFLQSVPDNGTIFLLGDIFDFFFEYKTVVSKRYFDIFHAIYEGRSRGVAFHFLGGNHDYWVGDFLKQEIGVVLHDEDIFIECQGRKIYCSHGDLFMPGDRSYRVIRSMMRNPLVIRVTRTLFHPDLMDAIARGVSKGGHNRNRRIQGAVATHLADTANSNFFSRGNDIFIMGHVHYPMHRVRDGREFMIVGDWIQDFTFGKLKDGKLTLETFKSETRD